MSGLIEQLSGAAAARAEGESAQNIANFNAAVEEQRAKAVEKRAAFGQQRQAKKAAAIKSTLTAKLAKAGGLGSPVAADLAAEQTAELELENLLIGFEGQTVAAQARSQAVLDRLQGRLSREKGKNLATASNVQFALQLASFAPGFGGGGSPPPQQPIPQRSFLQGFGGNRTPRGGLFA